MYNLFTKYLLYTNTYFVCIIYLFLMAFYVLVLKITNSVMLIFLCPTTIQTLIIFDIFSRRINSGILCSARKPHVFQLSSHLPVLGHIYSHTNLAGTMPGKEYAAMQHLFIFSFHNELRRNSKCDHHF
jgi:hypothetical protein